MISETQIQAIKDTITEYSNVSFDIRCKSEDVLPRVVDSDMAFTVSDSEKTQENWIQLALDRNAASQYLAKIKVPISFFFRCPAEIQKSILEYFHLRTPWKNCLLRCRRTEEELNLCRAVLSSTYTVQYDDVHTFPPVLDVLKTNSNLTSRRFVKDDWVTRYEVLIDNTEITFRDRNASAGLMISNSETGHSALWIEPMILINNSYVLSNRNYLRRNWLGYRLIHRGQGVTQESVQQSVTNALEAAQVGLVQYFEHMESNLEKKAAIDFMSSIVAFPKRFVRAFEKDWNNETEINKLSLVDQILYLARELPILAQMQVEQSVGKWLGLFNHYPDRLTSLVEEISSMRSA
jgi:hypothetical protein